MIISCRLLRLSEILVEVWDGLQALIELVEAIALVRRVDGILREAEAQLDRLDAEDVLVARDDWNRATRVEWKWCNAECSLHGLLRCLVCREVGG